MEPIGLVVGLVGLYSACIETAHRIESYKHFQSEARLLLVKFQADKAILQHWADSVGILNDRLSETYDRRLDDRKIGLAVQGILLAIQTLLKSTEESPSESFQQGASSVSAARQIAFAQGVTETVSISFRKRDRLAWTFGGKGRFTALVDTFGALVGKLHGLVPLKTNSERQLISDQQTQLGLEGEFSNNCVGI